MINNETYVSEEMKEVARIFYKHGLKIGESLKDSFKSGHVDLSKPITVLVPVEDLDISRFSLLTRVTMPLLQMRKPVWQEIPSSWLWESTQGEILRFSMGSRRIGRRKLFMR